MGAGVDIMTWARMNEWCLVVLLTILVISHFVIVRPEYVEITRALAIIMVAITVVTGWVAIVRKQLCGE